MHSPFRPALRLSPSAEGHITRRAVEHAVGLCDAPRVARLALGLQTAERQMRKVFVLAIAPAIVAWSALAAPGVTTTGVNLRSGAGNELQRDALAPGRHCNRHRPVQRLRQLVRRNGRWPEGLRQREVSARARRSERLAPRIRRGQGTYSAFPTTVHRVNRLQDDRGAVRRRICPNPGRESGLWRDRSQGHDLP